MDSGYVDPWRPYRPDPVPERQISGAIDAAAHLMALGLAPRFDQTTLRALATGGNQDLVAELRRAS